MRKVVCSLGYHSSKVNDLPVFAGGVRDGIYGNAVEFATPPIAQVDFQKDIDQYNDTRYAYEQGGLAQKGPYLEAKSKLMGSLDTMASYVSTLANSNANIITLAGFVPTKSNRSGAPKPVTPTDVQLKRGASGQLLAECARQNIVLNYGCILTPEAPLPYNVIINDGGQLVYEPEVEASNGAAANAAYRVYIDLNPTRKKLFQNLTPGIKYYVTFFAANSTGVSSLSPSVALICG